MNLRISYKKMYKNIELNDISNLQSELIDFADEFKLPMETWGEFKITGEFKIDKHLTMKRTLGALFG